MTRHGRLCVNLPLSSSSSNLLASTKSYLDISLKLTSVRATSSCEYKESSPKFIRITQSRVIDSLWRRCCRSYQIAANSYSMTSRMFVELGSNKYRTFMWRSNDCCRHFHLAHSPSEPRKEAKAARGLDCRQPLSLLYPSSLSVRVLPQETRS